MIALKIRECEEQGMTYEQVIETVMDKKTWDILLLLHRLERR